MLPRIEGLTSLVRLRWLGALTRRRRVAWASRRTRGAPPPPLHADLSFNRIEVIEGLDSLTALTDLVLTGNRIQHLQGVQALRQLEVLSLGSNRLASLKEVAPLHHSAALRVLNLAGNPLTAETDYRLIVVAYCPQLVNLDFSSVTPAERQAVKDNAIAADDVRRLQEDAKMRRVAASDADAAQADEAALAAANCRAAATLPHRITVGDPLWASLRGVPGALALMTDFQQLVQEAAAAYRSGGLAAGAAITQEGHHFAAAMGVLAADSDAAAKALIAQHARQVKAAARGDSHGERSAPGPHLQAATEEMARALRAGAEAAAGHAEAMLDLYDTELRTAFGEKASVDERFFEEVEAAINALHAQLAACVEASKPSAAPPAEADAAPPPDGASVEHLRDAVKELLGNQLTRMNEAWEATRKAHAAWFADISAAARAAEVLRSRTVLSLAEQHAARMRRAVAALPREGAADKL